jgi:hypothetical protein
VGIKLLKLTDCKPHMYKSRFKNKKLFWAHVKETKEKRAKNKPTSRRTCNRTTIADIHLGFKYAHQIDSKNYDCIRSQLCHAGIKPANVEYRYMAGAPHKSMYAGSHTNGYYAGHYRGYPITEHVIHICAPRVLTIEVNSFDGLYNVHCKRVKSLGAVELFEAHWIVRKRGFDFEIVKGFVARLDNICYHGLTVRQAVEGLRRKTKKVVVNLRMSDVIGVKRFIALTGACLTGCEDFCNRHDIDISKRYRVDYVIELLSKCGRAEYADKLKKLIGP